MKKEKKIKTVKYILITTLIVLFSFSVFASYRGFEVGGNDEVRDEALSYINNEILPDLEIETEAEITQIDRVLMGEYTHYIFAHHKEGRIEGRRRADGTYQFSVKLDEE